MSKNKYFHLWPILGEKKITQVLIFSDGLSDGCFHIAWIKKHICLFNTPELTKQNNPKQTLQVQFQCDKMFAKNKLYINM